jgi:hypothetical protein
MHDGRIRWSIHALGMALMLFSTAAWAEPAPQRVNVRGTIEKVDGDTLTVKSREGEALIVKLADNPRVLGLVKISLADVKAGSYVGVSSVQQPDGSRRALHVHVFLEAMRGVGEGDRPFDLVPQSRMTNATVAEVASVGGGQLLTLKYKDGEQKIIVPADAPIVTYSPGSKDEVKPGAKIMIFNATKQADGTLTSPSINVGRDGLTPPM